MIVYTSLHLAAVSSAVKINFALDLPLIAAYSSKSKYHGWVFSNLRLLHNIMGEAKRRKQTTGDSPVTGDRIVPWLPLTKKQSEAFVVWSTRGAWFGIGALALLWLTVRLIGPAAGWWTTQ